MGCIVINLFNRYHRIEITEPSVNEIQNAELENQSVEPIKPRKPRKRKFPVEVDESLKQAFRDSLDNERVKAKYKLTPKD